MRKNSNKKTAGILTGIFLIAFIVCIGFMAASFLKEKKLNDNMQELQNITQAATQPDTNAADISKQLGIDIPAKNLDFKELKKSNPDIYAWIYIPGTSVDYPVLQHSSDDTFYLEHNIDGSSGLPGCIYSEMINGISFDDRNTVLYGHNMRNGSMFATLHRYADKNFFDENRYIFIYTQNTTLVYEIFAAYTYSDVHLLKGIDITSDEKFQDYINSVYGVRGMSDNLAEDLTVTGEDKIITLSTCTGDDSKRYLVQGVLLNDRQ